MATDIRTVTIPSCSEHEGYPGNAIKVVLEWVCPICGGPRGEPSPTVSYDGSRRLGVDGWTNPCGHVDKYVDVRTEIRTNGLNPQYATPEMQS